MAFFKLGMRQRFTADIKDALTHGFYFLASKLQDGSKLRMKGISVMLKGCRVRI